jgi:hypothetical protein
LKKSVTPKAAAPGTNRGELVISCTTGASSATAPFDAMEENVLFSVAVTASIVGSEDRMVDMAIRKAGAGTGSGWPKRCVCVFKESDWATEI